MIEPQTNVAQKIQKSFALRRKSERLLEIVKEGVEMAIEKEEKTAMEWIGAETKKISKYDQYLRGTIGGDEWS